MKTLSAVLSAVLLGLTGCGGGDAIQIPQGLQPLPLVIDVKSVALDGNLLLNGVLFPMSQYETGTISLTHADGSWAVLGETKFNDYAVSVIPGTYATTYQYDHGGSVVPLNPLAEVGTGLDLVADRTLHVDVTAVEVQSAFTLNGAPFPASNYDNARFLLRPTAGGGSILLGESHLANDPIFVVPGTYDVIYQLKNGGTAVPINRNAVVMSAVVIAARTVLAVDILSVNSRTTLTLDSGAFPVSGYDYGDIYLRNPTTGDHALVGRSYQAAILNPVIEGIYDVVYQHREGETVPTNQDAILATGVPVNGASPSVSVDVPTATITPSFLQNGGAFGGNLYNRGDFFLRGSTEDDLVDLGSSHDNSPDPVRIVKGTYDVIYSYVQGEGVPLNPWVEVAAGLGLSADQALPIDVATAIIEPGFSLNGGDFPGSVYENGRFELRNVATPADVLLLGYSRQNQATDPVRIVEGTYDVLYTLHEGGEDVPNNKGRVVQAAVPLTVSQLLPVNVEAKEVKPTFTLDGAPFPASIYQSARFWLRDTTNGESLLLGYSYADNAPVMVLHGTYDVLYEHAQGDMLPQNLFTVVGGIDVQ